MDIPPFVHNLLPDKSITHYKIDTYRDDIDRENSGYLVTYQYLYIYFTEDDKHMEAFFYRENRDPFRLEKMICLDDN